MVRKPQRYGLAFYGVLFAVADAAAGGMACGSASCPSASSSPRASWWSAARSAARCLPQKSVRMHRQQKQLEQRSPCVQVLYGHGGEQIETTADMVQHADMVRTPVLASVAKEEAAKALSFFFVVLRVSLRFLCFPLGTQRTPKASGARRKQSLQVAGNAGAPAGF